MIKLQDYTPDVYYNESRDFQFIGRLYDLVLNYTKTNVDLLYNLPFNDNSDDQFIDLLALTLGFKAKHKYTSRHLRAICSCLAEILRNKGTLNAILIACNAIFHADGISGDVGYSINNYGISIYLPTALKDTTLLTDLFTYIIPAGFSCNIVKLIQQDEPATTEIALDNVVIYKRSDSGIYDMNEYSNIAISGKAQVPNPLIGKSQSAFVNSFIHKPNQPISNQQKEQIPDQEEGE